MVSRILFAALVPLFLMAGTQGPDSGGYTATDTGVFSFADISGGGASSILGNTDDGVVAVTLPFAFTFYGTPYTRLCVSSNGAAYFVVTPAVCSTISDFANADLSAGAPTVDLPAIFPFWTDLTFQNPGAGSLLHQTLGVAPNRRFVLQWHNAYPQGAPNPVNLQAIFFETTNTLAFQYQTVTLGGGNPASDGGLATVGIRNTGGQITNQQLQWSYNAPVLTDGATLTFTPGVGPLPSLLTLPTNGASSVVAPVNLTWSASAGATSYDVYLGTTNPPALVSNVAGTTYSPAGLSASTTYNWQVVARNGLGSAPSAVWTFTTAAAPPSGGSGGGGGGGGGGVGGGSALVSSIDTATITAPLNAGISKQTVTITFQTYTQGAPTFTTNTSTNQGFGWLSITPTNGTMTQVSYAGFLYTYQATATINVDPTGFPAGTSYTGGASFSAGGGVAIVNVTMNVVAQPSVFTFSPQTLQFTYRKGDAKLPGAQSLALSSKPTGTAWAAAVATTTGGNWLIASPATGTAPASVSAALNATVVQALAVGNYSGKVTITGNGATTVEIPVTLTIIRADAPVVTQGGVVPVYSTSNAIQAGSWISIYGTNLAASTEVWKGDFPTTLGGVSVTVNGKPGYLWFVSPTQINLQAPDDTATGTVTIAITTPTGTTTSTATLASASPSFSLLDGKHVAAIIPETGGYSIVGPTGAFAYGTRPVLPGENLILYGVGFGPTNPPVKAGELFASAAPTVSPVTVTIGGVPAPVAFSGLVGAGLYQLNVTVPAVGPGDQPIQASVNGVQVPVGPVVTVASR